MIVIYVSLSVDDQGGTHVYRGTANSKHLATTGDHLKRMMDMVEEMEISKVWTTYICIHFNLVYQLFFQISKI